MTKKLFIFALILSLPFPLLFSVSKVSAISDYDSAYQTTDRMRVSDDPGYWSNCVDKYLMTDWSKYVYQTSYEGTDYNALKGEQAKVARDKLRNAKAWFVSYYEVPNSYWGTTEVRVTFTEHEDTKLTWNSSGDRRYVSATLPTQGHMFSQITISAYEGNSHSMEGQPCPVRMSQFSDNNISAAIISDNKPVNDGTIGMGSSATSAVKNYLAAGTINPNYPPDYAGKFIRNNAPNAPVSLRFTYKVTKKDIEVTPMNNDPCIRFFRHTIGKVNNGDAQLLHYETLVNTTPYKHTVPEYGKYQYILDAPPNAPPPLLSNECGDKTFAPTSVQIDVNGQNFTGSTDDLECTINDGNSLCTQPNPLEDCSIYGADIIAGLGCHFRNMITSMKNLMLFLFVPSSAWFANYIDGLVVKLQQALAPLFLTPTLYGYLTSAFAGSSPLTDGSSDCPHYFGTLFGSPMSMNPCYILNRTGVLNTIRIIVDAGILISLAVFAHSRYRRIIG